MAVITDYIIIYRHGKRTAAFANENSKKAAVLLWIKAELIFFPTGRHQDNQHGEELQTSCKHVKH